MSVITSVKGNPESVTYVAGRFCYLSPRLLSGLGRRRRKAVYRRDAQKNAFVAKGIQKGVHAGVFGNCRCRVAWKTGKVKTDAPTSTILDGGGGSDVAASSKPIAWPKNRRTTNMLTKMWAMKKQATISSLAPIVILVSLTAKNQLQPHPTKRAKRAYNRAASAACDVSRRARESQRQEVCTPVPRSS